jgi:HEAT repeat protein
MYCLPRQKLVITGRDLYTAELTAAEVADTIEAGRKSKYGSLYSLEELLKRLGSWSPVVRATAANILAGRIKKGGPPISVLTDRLRGPDRYARYGACSALECLGPAAQPAVDDLIACLGSKDRVLQSRAAMALGTTDDARAVNALLKMAAREFPDDPFDMLHRYMGIGLFGDKNRNASLAETSTKFADRTALLAASHQLLRSITGQCRTLVARNVVPSLSLAEVKTLWPDLDFAFYATATSYNTAIQLEVLHLMAR